jgi:Mg2+ and Co2+ transporter CorA
MNVSLPFADSPRAFYGILFFIVVLISALLLFLRKRKII